MKRWPDNTFKILFCFISIVFFKKEFWIFILKKLLRLKRALSSIQTLNQFMSTVSVFLPFKCCQMFFCLFFEKWMLSSLTGPKSFPVKSVFISLFWFYLPTSPKCKYSFIILFISKVSLVPSRNNTWKKQG